MDLIRSVIPLMAAPLRFPRWVEVIIVLVLVAPLVIAVLPLEDGRFFAVAGSMSFAAPLGGLWFGEKRGRTIETRAGMGCLVTLGLFFAYGLWSVIAARFLVRLFY